MKILVYDVAASEAGALSMLRDFYDEVLESGRNASWIFVVGTPELPEAKNIEVLGFPWIKKSWLNRLWFDYFSCQKIIKKTSPDLIFSLQNLMIPRTKIPQVVYLHQALPFVPYRFTFAENKLFWVYQNIISKSIFSSVRKAKKIIVQTHWMKLACIDETAVLPQKIEVISPRADLSSVLQYTDTPEHRKVFFYPAGPYSYKNHELILKACGKLKQNGIIGYNMIFTLTGRENAYTQRLRSYAESEGLNVSFSGAIPREKLFSLYSESVLVFPSFIESFGLPLLEARASGALVLASDTPFSREILDGYKNSYFFNIEDYEKLSGLMAECISGEIKYDASAVKAKPDNGTSLVGFLLDAAKR